ncbi:MAG: Clp protease N-terminal domain-containing protein [Christensenellales bacterium]
MAFSDRCSEGAKKALALAQDAARSMGHNYVGSEHLLLGLINEGEGAAARALAVFNITADGVLERSEQLVGPETIILPIASAIPRAQKRYLS